jgi:ribulose-phosphate 3-epimerase
MKATSLANPRIAPSILSADFARLGEEIAAIEAGGADIVHVDVMDGHFVPNLTIGPPVIRALRRITNLPLDTHLMISNAEAMIPAYIDAGCDWISVQYEACDHLHRVVQVIAESGAKPGVALNPHTPPEVLKYVLPDLHHVLVMTVNPGFGGQSLIEGVLDKITILRQWIDAAGLDVRIEVDGGVKVDNIGSVRSAGADVFVAGSAVFKSGDYAATIGSLRQQALDADHSLVV